MDIQEFSDDLEIIESTTSSAMAELFKRHLPDHDFTIQGWCPKEGMV